MTGSGRETGESLIETYMLDVPGMESHDPEHMATSQEIHEDLVDAWETLLDDRERTILEMRLGIGSYEPMNNSQIAREMGFHRSRVPVYVDRAFGKLLKKMAKKHPDEFEPVHDDHRKETTREGRKEKVRERREVWVRRTPSKATDSQDIAH